MAWDKNTQCVEWRQPNTYIQPECVDHRLNRDSDHLSSQMPPLVGIWSSRVKVKLMLLAVNLAAECWFYSWLWRAKVIMPRKSLSRLCLQVCFAATCCLFVGSKIAPSYARGIADVRLSEKAIAPKCASINGEHASSSHASLFFSISGKSSVNAAMNPERKDYQSFACDGKRGTLYYFEYRSEGDAENAMRFAQGVIWGGAARSAEHSELIFTVENILVVISGSDPEVLESLLRKEPRSSE
jgi:hypothetical protein